MGQYKDMKVPDNLDNIIAYMRDVDSYREELATLGQAWDMLTILGQMAGGRTDMTTTREGFRVLTEHLISNLGQETLAKTIQDISSKAQVTVDIIIRNLFERTADIGFLATDDDIRDFIRSTLEIKNKVNKAEDENFLQLQDQQKKNNDQIVARFKEYVAKYSVYHNIILLDPKGNVLTQLDENNPVEHSSDPLLAESMQTKDEYVETFRHSDLLPNEDESLIYSYRVTESNDANSPVLGVLCLCFRFENELKSIFENLASEDDWSVLTLLDKNGKVIASNSPYQVPVNAEMERVLDQDYKIVKFSGRRYIAKTIATNGYQEFYGLGWYGHVMLPLDVAFEMSGSQAIKSVDQNILNTVLNNPNLFSEEIQAIPLDAEKIQSDLDRTVWNGNIMEETTESEASNSSKILLWEISKTGMKTKNVFGRSIENLHETVVSTYMNDVEFLASLAIDIMDRNLYERANDCRWWALTSEFRRILSSDNVSQDDSLRMTNILAYINDLYTVYTNLFVYDTKGKIIAVSNSSQEYLVGTMLNEQWVSETMNIRNSQMYSVSPFDKTPLYGDKNTYIYNASITDPENQQRVVGGIGIVFDSEPEFHAMLTDSLPRNNQGDYVAGCFAVFTDKNGCIISSTNATLKLGERLEIDSLVFTVSAGNSTAKIIEFNDHYYAVGIKSSNGYREYKSDQDCYKNDVYGFVFMELDKVQSDESFPDQQVTQTRSGSSHLTPSEDYVEIATFYIGNQWYGIESKDVIEAIEYSQPTTIPGMPDAVVGSLFYRDRPIMVLNPSNVLGAHMDIKMGNVQIVVIKTALGLTGIVVESLGEIPKVENKRLDTGGTLTDTGKYIQSLVKPASSNDKTPMLIVLNPDELHKHLTASSTGMPAKIPIKTPEEVEA